MAAYQSAHPELAAEFERRVVKGELPADFAARADAFIQECQEAGKSWRLAKPHKMPSKPSANYCLSCLAVPPTWQALI